MHTSVQKIFFKGINTFIQQRCIVYQKWQ